MNAANGSTFNMGGGSELDVLGSADLGGTGAINGHIDDVGASVTFDPTSSMSLDTGTSLTGSLYNIFGPVTVNTALSQDAKMVLDNNGSSTGGSLTGPGSLSDSTDFDWNGGDIGLDGGTSFLADADLKLDTSESKVLLSGTLTNQCNGSTIGGDGTLLIYPEATFDNLGNPNCIVTISTISVLGSGRFINDGDGFFDEEGDTTITGNFINNGIIQGGGTLTLTAGELNGRLMLDGGSVTVAGSMTSSGLELGPGSGTLYIGTPDGSSTGSLDLGGSGITVAGITLEVTSSGTLTGGSVDNNNGVMKLDANSDVLLTSYIQTSSAQLTLEVASPYAYASLSVIGDASLSGTLNFDYYNGYTPSSGTSFIVLRAGSIEEHFLVIPPDTMATYDPTTVTITEI